MSYCWGLQCYCLWLKYFYEELLPIIVKLYNKSCMEDHHTLNESPDRSSGLQVDGDQRKWLNSGLGKKNKNTHRTVKPHTFGVETTAPGLSAARLAQALTLKGGGGKDRFWVCGEKATGKRQWMPILCRADLPRCSHLFTWESHIYRTSTRKTADGLSWPIKSCGDKGPPDVALEHCNMM